MSHNNHPVEEQDPRPLSGVRGLDYSIGSFTTIRGGDIARTSC